MVMLILTIIKLKKYYNNGIRQNYKISILKVKNDVNFIKIISNTAYYIGKTHA